MRVSDGPSHRVTGQCQENDSEADDSVGDAAIAEGFPCSNGINGINGINSCQNIWVCLKMVSTPKPNGFADHYPYEKWLFHWEY